MIGKLKGFVDEIFDDHIIIDVQGVGYVVFISQRLMAKLPAIGTPIMLYIETQMREDAVKLFGFHEKIERDWFRLLQNVQGVGAKVALALLASLTPSQLANAIALRDMAIICRAQGVGKKVAERIIAELKDKVANYLPESNKTIDNLAPMQDDEMDNNAVHDAISALCNLGYMREQAAKAVAIALKQAGELSDSAKLIRLGLKELSR